MPFSRATFHFAAVPDVCQAYTLFVHTDGYPSGAADDLRTMLLDCGASHARAFQQAHQQRAYVAKEPHGDDTTSFRYFIDEYSVVAEERVKPGVDQWETVFSGQLLVFIRDFCKEPLLHATGPRAEGDGINYQTLEMMETYLAEAQREAIRYEAGVWGVGAGPEAQGRVETLRERVLAALRQELLVGREKPA